MHIEKLNTIQHNHSLVAIKDTFSVESKRYLTYYDEKWECKLFLNFKTIEEDNENNLIENLNEIYLLIEVQFVVKLREIK